MRRIAICAVAMALSAAGAGAQAPPANELAAMHDFFGAALQIDLPGGQWSAKRYYAPDHTYRERGSNGDVHGVWSIENGKICAAQANRPEGSPARYCNVGLGKKLGQTWRDTDPVTGNTVTFTLKPA
jgi:hypothetical protein